MATPGKTTRADRPHPWSWRREALFAAALFVVILGVYSLTWFQGLGVSVSTIGAERVLRGEFPYRDFWTMYAPGHFYLLALLFRIFGTHILVETIAASVVCAAAAILCYRLGFNLVRKRLEAIACAGIFVAATFNTGYFKSLGSYPPAVFFLLAALNCIVLHYKTEHLRHLLLAGFATGAVVAFKHDVGGYTAIAIAAGLVAHRLLFPATRIDRTPSAVTKLTGFCAGIAVIVLPLSILFLILSGKDILLNLIVFPLTDFRFARPEHYPGLFDFDIQGKTVLSSLLKLFAYVKFTLPFVLFLLGLIATAKAVRGRNPAYVALGVTFSVGFLLHYSAAHIQISTHIISMSIYASLLGVMFFHMVEGDFEFWQPALTRLFSLMLVGGWYLSLMAAPADQMWTMRRWLTTELELDKVSRVKFSSEGSRMYSELLDVVNTQTRPDEKLFVGLHRHDVVIVGANAADYFILNRPIATRYHELHPAVADTVSVQREMVRDLRDQNVSLIILKSVFPDEVLNGVKADLVKKLPQIGATDLDTFIRTNYVEVRKIGSNAVWKRKKDDARPGAPQMVELHPRGGPR